MKMHPGKKKKTEPEMIRETQSVFIDLLKSPQVSYIFCCLSGKDGKGKTKGKQEHSDYA